MSGEVKRESIISSTEQRCKVTYKTDFRLKEIANIYKWALSFDEERERKDINKAFETIDWTMQIGSSAG